MSLSVTIYDGYDVLAVDSEICINLLPVLTPHLSQYIQQNPNKNLVLDLSKVPMVDSSGFRLFLNLKKRIESNGKKLYLFNPTPHVQTLLTDVNFDKVVQIINSTESLHKTMTSDIFEGYRSFTAIDGNHLKLRCKCTVCGSTNVIGYLVDRNSLQWEWIGESPFPTATQNGVRIDYFGMLPIVCLDCFMCSTDVSHFHMGTSDAVIGRSTLDSNSKLLLSKTIKKRKKMIEMAEMSTSDFLSLPRNEEVVLQAYLLAESCARTIAVNHSNSIAFQVGFLNYVALEYAAESQKQELINNCRSWLTQVLNAKQNYNHTQLSQAYYILFLASITLMKIKEASILAKEFSEMIQNIHVQEENLGLDNPNFWFKRVNEFWSNEIESRFKNFKL